MAGLVELLGEKLTTKDGEGSTAELLAGKKAIALYFSGHWCPPCRGFTPQLAEWYKNDLKAKGLEVVFVSSDRDEGSFKEYFAEQPWLALPYSDRDRKNNISKKFKVQGIPTVVILDGEGNVMTKDGREALSSDPKGDDMPWKEKTLPEILAGCKIIGKEGEVGLAALKDKVYAFYFSGHWCPPCRGFTPKFAEWYTKSLKAKGLEVVFVSSDRDEKSFKEYFAEMPWLAIDFANRKEKSQLSSLFGIEGIPSVVIIDKDGSVISKEGVGDISSDPEGENFPWHPKPVKDLAAGPGSLNETACVIALCEATSTDAQKAAEAAMEPIAKKYIDQAKAEGEDDPKVAFMICKKAGGIGGKLREVMELPALPPPVHEHEMKEHDGAGGRWGCDGCGKGGPDVFGDKKRYRCTAGCDYDYCEDCYAKMGTGGEVPCKLMLINIPDNKAFYAGPEGDITAASVENFVTAFESGSAERKELSM